MRRSETVVSRAACLPKPSKNRTTSTIPTIAAGIPTHGMKMSVTTPIKSSASPTPIMTTTCPRPLRRKPRLAAIDDHEALFGHLAYGPRGTFLRVARVLDAAVGHLVAAERRRFVHRNATELEALRCAQRRRDRGGEDPGLEAESRALRPLDRFVERVVGVDDADRPEDLVARDLCVVGHVGEHRRLQQLVVSAAGDDACACSFRFIDPHADAFLRIVVNHWADVGVVVA